MKAKLITIRTNEDDPQKAEAVFYYENGSRIAFPISGIDVLDFALTQAEKTAPCDIRVEQ